MSVPPVFDIKSYRARLDNRLLWTKAIPALFGSILIFIRVAHLHVIAANGVVVRATIEDTQFESQYKKNQSYYLDLHFPLSDGETAVVFAECVVPIGGIDNFKIGSTVLVDYDRNDPQQVIVDGCLNDQN